jgi:hypothetical protein
MNRSSARAQLSRIVASLGAAFVGAAAIVFAPLALWHLQRTSTDCAGSSHLRMAEQSAYACIALGLSAFVLATVAWLIKPSTRGVLQVIGTLIIAILAAKAVFSAID